MCRLISSQQVALGLRKELNFLSVKAPLGTWLECKVSVYRFFFFFTEGRFLHISVSGSHFPPSSLVATQPPDVAQTHAYTQQVEVVGEGK